MITSNMTSAKNVNIQNDSICVDTSKECHFFGKFNWFLKLDHYSPRKECSANDKKRHFQILPKSYTLFSNLQNKNLEIVIKSNINMIKNFKNA